jgi:hypothetical protein
VSLSSVEVGKIGATKEGKQYVGASPLSKNEDEEPFPAPRLPGLLDSSARSLRTVCIFVIKYVPGGVTSPSTLSLYT